MLKFLGRGGAFNPKDGNTSAFDYIGTELFLMDCGEDVFKKLLEKGILNNITRANIFITHTHSDHTGSLGSLIFYLYMVTFSGDKSRINVYFPTNSLRELLKLQGVTEDYYTYYINRWDELYPDGCNRTIEYEFTDCTHVNELKQDTFSIIISDKLGETFFFSGDTNSYASALNNTHAFDHIYHEVTCYSSPAHMNYGKLLEYTKSLSPDEKKKFVLMHLDADFDEQMAYADGFSVASIVQ